MKMVISDLGDGNMRFFGDGDEQEIISNQRKLAEKLGVSRMARVRTVYEERKDFTEYYVVTEENSQDFLIDLPEEKIQVSDGLMTKMTEVGMLLPLADCLGIVIFDSVKKAIGLLHAGRHNLEQFGPQKFVQRMAKEFGCDPGDLEVHFSPCARSNYGLYKFDGKTLAEVAKEQLTEVGVTNITESLVDTTTDANFPSHSQGDTKKRFAVAVKL